MIEIKIDVSGGIASLDTTCNLPDNIVITIYDHDNAADDEDYSAQEYMSPKTAWIQALRSGKYEQTQNQLRNAFFGDYEPQVPTSHFCCLGVACDLYNPEGWEGSFKNIYQGEKSTMPGEVRDYFGLKPAQVGMLIDLNDTMRWSFTTIADVLEYDLLPDTEAFQTESHETIAQEIRRKLDEIQLNALAEV